MSQALSNVFKLKDIINVKDPAFGAKGDGVTDDTAAIQAALNSLTHGDKLYFPETSNDAITTFYRITSALTLPVKNGIHIYGDGLRSSIIRQTTAGQNIFNSGSVWATNTNGFQISNILLQGNSNAPIGINWVAMSRATARNVRITGCTTAGIKFTDSLIVRLLACEFDANNDGLLEIGSLNSGVNGFLFSGCKFENQTQYSASFTNLNGGAIVGCTIEASNLGGLRFVQDCTGVSIAGNYFEANNVSLAVNPFDIHLGSSSLVKGFDIRGNYFNGSTGDADYYPIVAERCFGLGIGSNFVNTGNNYINFKSSASLIEIDVEMPAFGSGSFSETLTYANIPANFYDYRVRNRIRGYTHHASGEARQSFVRRNALQLHAGLWTQATVGSGTIANVVNALEVSTGVTGSSTARASQSQLGTVFDKAQGNTGFSNDHHWSFVIGGTTFTTNGNTWIGVYKTATSGNPADKAFGFRIDNNAVKGFVHNGSALNVTDLSFTLSAGLTVVLEMLKTDTEIEWWINGVKRGSNTTQAQLPSGDDTAVFQIAVANNADTADQQLYLISAEHRVTST